MDLIGKSGSFHFRPDVPCAIDEWCNLKGVLQGRKSRFR